MIYARTVERIALGESLRRHHRGDRRQRRGGVCQQGSHDRHNSSRGLE